MGSFKREGVEPAQFHPSLALQLEHNAAANVEDGVVDVQGTAGLEGLVLSHGEVIACPVGHKQPLCVGLGDDVAILGSLDLLKNLVLNIWKLN